MNPYKKFRGISYRWKMIYPAKIMGTKNIYRVFIITVIDGASGVLSRLAV